MLLDLPLSKEYFLSLFTAEGLTSNILTTTPQSEVMRGLVGQGYGYILANVHPRNRHSLDESELIYSPLLGDCTKLTLGLLTRNCSQKGAVTSAFASHVRQLLTSGQVPGMEAL